MKDAYQCSPIPIIITYRNHNRNEEKLTSSTPQPLPCLYHTPTTTLLHPPYLCHAHLTLPLLQPYHIPTLTLPQPNLNLTTPLHYLQHTPNTTLPHLYHTLSLPLGYLHLTTPQPQSYITPTIAFPHLTLILPHYTTPLPYLYHTLTVTLPHPYRTSTTPLPYLNHTHTTTLPHLYHTLLRTPFIDLNYILYYCIANRPIYSIQYMGFDICIQIFGYLSLMESLHKGNRGEKL